MIGTHTFAKPALARGALLTLLWVGLAPAADDPVPAAGAHGMTREQFEQSLHYQDGAIKLKGGLATLQLPSQFRYLNADDTARVLTEAWGNPRGNDTLGMIVPKASGAVGEHAWGVIVTYEEDGYVSDKDADSIKYDELLEQMRAGGKAINEERAKQGFAPIELVGWAEPPHYDAANHKLFWAKEIKFGSDASHTLNYNIRVLGRRGVLVLNAVAAMDQLPVIREQTPAILAATDFDPGSSYTDFNGDTDKVAAYGLAALVAGGIAAKTGLIAKLVALALAGKKVLGAILVALWVGLRKLFQRRQARDA